MEKTQEIGKELKLIAKSSVIVFIGLFLSKVFFYLYRLVVARVYGPEFYGLFSLAVIILLWTVSLFSFGLDQGLLRFIAYFRGKNEKEKIKNIFNYSIKFLLVSSIFAGIILFLLAETISINLFHNPNLIIFLQIFSFLIPVYIFTNIFLATIRAHENIFWYSMLENIIPNFLKLAILLIFFWIGLALNIVALSFFLGIFMTLIIAYFILKKIAKYLFHDNLNVSGDKEVKKSFFNYSWPIMFLGVVNSIFYWIDSFMIGIFSGAVDVGFYNAVVPIAALLGFIPEIFMQLFFPLITKEFSKKNFEKIKQLSQQIGKWIFILNLPLFFLMFLFPEQIILLLFGEEYIVAQNALRILSFGTLIATLSVSISRNLLLSLGRSKLMLFNITLLSSLNFILNFVLIPKFGINGAAFATTLSNIILGSILLLEIYFFKSIIPIRRKIFRIFLVSLMPLFVVIFIKNSIETNIFSFVLLSIFFLLFYTILLFLTKCLDKNDFFILFSLKDKFLQKSRIFSDDNNTPGK